eukprot:tig00000734_g3758.t1
MASEKAPSPLRAVYVTGTIDTFFSDISIRQVYKNESAGPIEAVFRFPLPEGAAVIGWEARVGDRRIAGVVREREKAAEEYSAAIAGGHGAYLLEREAPDVFTASAGTCWRGRRRSSRSRAVRDEPGAARGGPAPIASIASPTHAPDLGDGGGAGGRVRLARAVPMDGALVLEVAHAAPRAPHAWAERAEDGSACLALCLCPEFEAGAPPAPGEFLFLVDRSGSMAGSKMEQTKNALQIMLRALPPGSAFDLVGFGSSFRRLFAAPAPYGDASLAEAARAVAALQADLGGTELLAPLRALLAARPRRPAPPPLPPHRRRGQQHGGVHRGGAGGPRRHAPLRPRIGAGRRSTCGSRLGLPGAAQAPPPSPPPPAASASSPTPSSRRHGALPASVTLTARGPAGPVAFSVAVPPGAGGRVTALAARAAVRELEEAPDGAAARRRILELGLRHSLATRETAFVAVERRDAPPTLRLAQERERERPAPMPQACMRMARCRRAVSPPAAMLAVDAVMLQEQCEELEVEAAEFKRSAARLKRSDAHCRTLSVGGLFRKKERGAAGPPSSSPAASPAAARAELNRGTPAARRRRRRAAAGEGGRRHDAVLALQAASGLWALTRPSPPPSAPARRPRRRRPAAVPEAEWGLCADKARRALDALGAAPAPHRLGPRRAAAVSAA